MQDLTVIGAENGALLVSSGEGTRYRIAIDEVLHSKLRQATPAPQTAGRKLAPREIQAHIRSGMSAEEVAAITGASVEYIQKYEGPVLAEREFVLESALNVSVHTAIETDPSNQNSTFGSVIRDRLQDLGASGERWASWKEADGGWVVKLSFTADQIDHDARWHYEPRKSALAPLNSEANTLSQQGEMPGGLIPRLRAVGGDERALDSSRFDSGAFDVKQSRGGDGSIRDTAPQLESIPFSRNAESSPGVSGAAINRAPVEEGSSSQTADLLEALRRRRGERESAALWNDTESNGEAARSAHPSTGSIRLIDVPLDNFEGLDDDSASTAKRTDQTSSDRSSSEQLFAGRSVSARAEPSRAGSAQSGSPAGSSAGKGSPKRGRASMPSWDEIVFGARSDDDPS